MIYNSQIINLTNGENVYADTLESTQKKIQELEGKTLEINGRIQILFSNNIENDRKQALLTDKILSRKSTFGKIFSFLSSDQSFEDLEREKQKIIQNSKSILEEIKKHEETVSPIDIQINKLKSELEVIYDFFPTYPPDWNDRKKKVKTRDIRCVKCRREGEHVHHKTPLDKGGSNLPTNLEYLCEKCHSKCHGGRQFDYSKSDFSPNEDSSSFAQKKSKIEEAIRNGSKISFSYKKFGESRSTKRTITPKSLVSIDHDSSNDQTLCVNGICHLRKAERNFALKRLTDLKTID